MTAKVQVMARAIWQGSLSFGLVKISVGLVSAESRQRLELDLLDKRDFAPIGYEKINKATGKKVAYSDIVKGYEYEDGQYVLLSEDELATVHPKLNKNIEILSFADGKE